MQADYRECCPSSLTSTKRLPSSVLNGLVMTEAPLLMKHGLSRLLERGRENRAGGARASGRIILPCWQATSHAEICDQAEQMPIERPPSSREPAPRQCRTRVRDSRDHLRALAQRGDVIEGREVWIADAKSEILWALTAIPGVEAAAFAMPSFITKWRAVMDENEYYSFAVTL